MENTIIVDGYSKLELQKRISEPERELSECRAAETFRKDELYQAEKKIIELQKEIKKLKNSKEET